MNTTSRRQLLDSAGKSQAARWLEFYAECIVAQERILAEMVEVAGSLTEKARDTVEETDIRPLRSVIEMCRRRRDLARSILDTAVEKN